jgi:stage V sporulation protein S
MKNDCKMLRVKSDPRDATDEERKKAVKKLAGAIAHALRSDGEVGLRCFGNACIGKACKAMTIAKGYIAPHGYDLYFTPMFIDAKMTGDQRKVGLCFMVYPSYPE